jgi:acyl-CoA thioesterase-2
VRQHAARVDAPAAELLRELITCLDLERASENTWIAHSERDRHGRVYGGQSLAQALVAAARSAEGWPVHVLHAFFLEPGDPAIPLECRVERLQDTRSFARRRVSLRQPHGGVLEALVSLQPIQSGPEHASRMPEAPSPDSLPTAAELAQSGAALLPDETRAWAARPRALDVRYTTPPASLGGRGSASNLIWIRAPLELPDDPLLHQALIAYASDLSFNDNAARPHAQLGRLGLRMASLDHVLWLHRPARADEWLLFAQESPHAARARGFVRAQVFQRDGTHVASIAQECLLRPAQSSSGISSSSPLEE